MLISASFFLCANDGSAFAPFCCQLSLEIEVTWVACVFCGVGKNFILLSVPQGVFRSTKLEDWGFGSLVVQQIRKTADDASMWLLHC